MGGNLERGLDISGGTDPRTFPRGDATVRGTINYQLYSSIISKNIGNVTWYR